MRFLLNVWIILFLNCRSTTSKSFLIWMFNALQLVQGSMIKKYIIIICDCQTFPRLINSNQSLKWSSSLWMWHDKATVFRNSVASKKYFKREPLFGQALEREVMRSVSMSLLWRCFVTNSTWRMVKEGGGGVAKRMSIPHHVSVFQVT